MVKIRELREELGISQKELAERCGITQSTLCDIEMGRNNPSIEVAIRLSRELGVNDINLFDKGGCVSTYMHCMRHLQRC